MMGSAVGGIALPLTAIETLGASAAQLGVLGAVATLPVLLFALPAGVWVDRWRRRHVLITADLGRAILLGTIFASRGIAALTGAWLAGWVGTRFGPGRAVIGGTLVGTLGHSPWHSRTHRRLPRWPY